jgi:hypothetical protein
MSLSVRMSDSLRYTVCCLLSAATAPSALSENATLQPRNPTAIVDALQQGYDCADRGIGYAKAATPMPHRKSLAVDFTEGHYRRPD